MATEPTRFGMQPHKFNGLFTEPLHLRTHSFLDDPRTSAEIKASIVDVLVAGQTPSSTGDIPTLPKGATNEQVLAKLAAWKSARVLRLADAEGIFSGWTTQPVQAMLFTTMMEYYLYRGAWCCTSRYLNNDADNGRVYLKQPPALSRPR